MRFSISLNPLIRQSPRIGIALIGCLALTLGSHGQTGGDIVPGEVVVRMQLDSNAVAQRNTRSSMEGELSTFLQRNQVLEVEKLSTPSNQSSRTAKVNYTSLSEDGVFRLRFSPHSDIQALIQELQNLPGIQYAEPNWLGHVAYSPNDSLYAQQQDDHAVIDLQDAWQTKISQGSGAGASPTIRVAVVDSGVDAQHPDLSNVLDTVNSKNIQADNLDISDDLGHGTRVAGIIAAQGNNSLGIAGVAFGCTLLSVDVCDSSGTITSANAVSGVNFARTHGASVINMSFRFSAASQALQDACEIASNAGILLVASAGNENQGVRPIYPASYSTVLGVGAITETGLRASFSNYNGVQLDLVDLFAPGTTIYSTIPGNQYNGTFGSGTSFAAGFVSGVGALLKSKYPGQSGAAIAQHMKSFASPPVAGFSPTQGAGSGILNAQSAIANPITPFYSISKVIVDDNPSLLGTNNSDGTLDHGETARISVLLRISGADSNVTTGALSTTNSLLTVTDVNGQWPAIGIGQSQANSDAFTVTLDSLATSSLLQFILTVSSDGGVTNVLLPVTLAAENEVSIPDPTNYFIPYTWTSDKTWVVEGQVNILNGLTIEPGTTVRTKPGALIDMKAGPLLANGTTTSPIKFKPYREETSSTITTNDLLWAIGAGSSYLHDRTQSLAIAADGNLLASGYFSGTSAFGNLSLSSTGYADAFISKVANDGNFIWAKGFGGNETAPFESDHASCVAATTDGGAFVAGHFINYAVLGSGETGETTLTASGGISSGDGDIFIARYLSNGQLSWAKGIGSDQPDSNNEDAFGLDNYPDGGFLVTGRFIDNAVFAKGEAEETTLTTSDIITGNDPDIFLARYSALGQLIWTKRAGGTGPDHGGSVVSLPSGGGYLTGSFTSTATFGPGESPGPGAAGEKQVSSSGVSDIFISRYNSNGTLSWVKKAGGTGPEHSHSITLSNDDSCVVVGTFSASATFGEGINSITLDSSGDRDIFIAKYDSAGELLWARQAGGAGPDVGTSVKPRGDDGIMVCGYFRDSSVFGPLEPGQVTLQGQGLEDAFIASYNADGSLTWVKRCGGPELDGAMAMSVSADGTTYLGGYHGSNAVFGVNEPGQIIRSASGIQDLFIAKIAGTLGWDGLFVRSNAASAQLHHCIFERGVVRNELASTSISHCEFNRSPGTGLVSTAGTGSIDFCSADSNRRSGFLLGARPALSCIATSNRESGIVTTSTVTDCTATYNGVDGLTGAGIQGSLGNFNFGRGLVSSAGISQASARGNKGNGAVSLSGNMTSVSSELNTGTGITISVGGTADGCTSKLNSTGGISTNGSTVQNCAIEENVGIGIAGSGTSVVSSCRITSNTLQAVTGVTSVSNSVVVANGSGLNGVGTSTNSYVSANYNTGITGGAISNSTIVGNSGNGVTNPTSVANCWVLDNFGTGIKSINTGSVLNSTIRGNRSGGIQDLGATGASNSNIYDNLLFEAKDTQLNVSGTDRKNFESNWWGTTATADMQTTSFDPFPPGNDIDPYIMDGFDLSTGWYLDYSPVAPVALANSPDNSPPAFLLTATPPFALEPVSVGPTTFTLVFSKDMDTSFSPAVTFGLNVPFTTHVVTPDPGWINPRTWVGKFAVQIDTGDGTNTLRVSQARDASGFVIPDDYRFSFILDSGSPSANNGLVIGTTSSRNFEWSEDDKPPTALGYNLMRSETGLPGSFRPVNSSVITGNTYTDSTADANATYYYYVTLIDSDFGSVDWTPVIQQTIVQAAALDWSFYY